MNLRSLSLTTLIAASLFAAGAQAHDPALHQAPPPQKAKPMTCDQLADTQRYSVDMADKELKTKCDAEAMQAKKEKDEKAKDDGKGD